MIGNIGSEIIELIKRPGTALQVSGQKGLLSTDTKSENNWRVCQTSGRRSSFLFFWLISKSIVLNLYETRSPFLFLEKMKINWYGLIQA